MVEVEKRIARTGDGVAHLAAYTPVSGVMRASFNAEGKVKPVGLGETPVRVLLVAGPADKVGDGPVNAVVVDDIARAKRVGVVDKGAIGNAAGGADTISAKAEDGVEQGRSGEGARVDGLVPVGLGTTVAAFATQGFLVRPDEEAVIGEELSCIVDDFCEQHVGGLEVVKDGAAGPDVELGGLVHQAKLGVEIGFLLDIGEGVPLSQFLVGWLGDGHREN